MASTRGRKSGEQGRAGDGDAAGERALESEAARERALESEVARRPRGEVDAARQRARESDPAHERRGEIDAAQAQALKLYVVLSRATSAVDAVTRRDIARHELTPAEFGVMEALYHRGPLLLSEVQRKILVSSGGITYLVDRLERRGLVERRACPDDRRASYAALTAEGERFIAAIFPAHAAVIARALAGLDPEEQLRATDLLRRLGHHASSVTVDAAPSEASDDGARAGSARRRSGKVADVDD